MHTISTDLFSRSIITYNDLSENIHKQIVPNLNPPDVAHLRMTCSSLLKNEVLSLFIQQPRRLYFLKKALQESMRENELYVESVFGMKESTLELSEDSQYLMSPNKLAGYEKTCATFAEMLTKELPTHIISKVIEMKKNQEHHEKDITSLLYDCDEEERIHYYLRNLQLMIYKQSILHKKYEWFNDKTIPKQVDFDRKKRISQWLNKSSDVLWSTRLLTGLHARERYAAQYAQDFENMSLFLDIQHASDFKEQLFLMNRKIEDIGSHSFKKYLYDLLKKEQCYNNQASTGCIIS